MFFPEFLRGLGILLTYFACAAAFAILIMRLFHPPRELTRKFLHIICMVSVFVYYYGFAHWYVAMFAALMFSVLVFPIVRLAGRFPKIMAVLNERKKGEVEKSLMIVHLMFAILIAVFWGLLGEAWKFIMLVAVLAWGFGDAAAALVGKAWGKHHLRHRWIEGAKTMEGTTAMFCVSFVVILITLLVYAALPVYACLIIAVIVAAICAAVELFSHGGIDTITVPIAAAIPTFLLVLAFV